MKTMSPADEGFSRGSRVVVGVATTVVECGWDVSCYVVLNTITPMGRIVWKARSAYNLPKMGGRAIPSHSTGYCAGCHPC